MLGDEMKYQFKLRIRRNRNEKTNEESAVNKKVTYNIICYDKFWKNKKSLWDVEFLMLRKAGKH